MLLTRTGPLPQASATACAAAKVRARLGLAYAPRALRWAAARAFWQSFAFSQARHSGRLETCSTGRGEPALPQPLQTPVAGMAWLFASFDTSVFKPACKMAVKRMELVSARPRARRRRQRQSRGKLLPCR